MTALPHEHVLFLFLDHGHQPIGALATTQGQRDHVTVRVRGVFAIARALRASAMIMVHNHPSGVLRASLEDMAVTAALMRHGSQRGIQLIDHWLVAGGHTCSIISDARRQEAIAPLTGGMPLRERTRPNRLLGNLEGRTRECQGNGDSAVVPDRIGDDAAFIRALIAIRRSRTDHLPRVQMADPAWDILLDIYACQLECRKLPITSVGTLADIPAATAQRWIRKLTQQGMLVRIADPKDRRRAHVSLTPTAWDGMRAWQKGICAMLSAC